MDQSVFRERIEGALRDGLHGRVLADIEIAALIDVVLHEVILFPSGVAVGAIDAVALARDEAADVVARVVGPPASPGRSLMLFNQKPFARDAYAEAAQRVRGYLAAAGAYFSASRGITLKELEDKRSADRWTGRFPPAEKGGSGD